MLAHCITNFFCRILPDLDDLFIALLFGQQSTAITLVDLIHFRLRSSQNGDLFFWNRNVSDSDGDA
ncbi:MAG: hypothetical protein ACD_34C00633G0001 [uncultured bacterium]|nr:MAG: hypothetical protein ACD_34C00633G0001 [uncultured bacterium]